MNSHGGRQLQRVSVCCLAVLSTGMMVGCASLNSLGLLATPRVDVAGSEERMQAEACRATGEELARVERDEQAIAQFLRARELNPKIGGTAHSLAVLYDRQRLLDAAEREYRVALKESPRDADVLNDYGYFLYSRGDFTGSESHLRAALKEHPEHAQARLNLAMTLAGQGRHDESFVEFERALGKASAHYNTAVLLLRSGESERGMEQLRMALREDPGLEAARFLVEAPVVRGMSSESATVAVGAF
ncbi:MAG: tetratricopeptide repeat protein [Planctomycetaceae bacterium]